MFGGDVVLVEDARGFDVVAIVGEEVVHYPLGHGGIARPGEQPDPVPIQVAGVIDYAAAGVPVSDRDQLCDVRGALPEAAERDAAARRCRCQKIALSAIVGPTSDDSRSPQRRGERDLELNGHEAAG